MDVSRREILTGVAAAVRQQRLKAVLEPIQHNNKWGKWPLSYNTRIKPWQTNSHR